MRPNNTATVSRPAEDTQTLSNLFSKLEAQVTELEDLSASLFNRITGSGAPPQAPNTASPALLDRASDLVSRLGVVLSGLNLSNGSL